MADASKHVHDEKEQKRQKQLKRMTKILSKAWGLQESEPFQESKKKSTPGNVFDLASIGQYLDEGVYKYGKNGWESFTRDIGGVYNRHIEKNNKFSEIAKKHRFQVQQMISKVNQDIAKMIANHIPRAPDTNKRKPEELVSSPIPHKKTKTDGKLNANGSANGSEDGSQTKASKDMTVTEREDKATDDLNNYIEEIGGDRSQVSSFRPRVNKRSDGKYDVNFINSEGKRFRSMVDVARFLGLVADKKEPKRFAPSKRTPSSSREADNEKKKLRKELDKLMKAHQKASKALDDLRNEQSESRYPVEDDVLIEEEAENGHGYIVSELKSPAAQIPDIDGFPGVPDHCVPDLLMVWDFLCTFGRALSLNPVSLDDFVEALSYQIPEAERGGDGLNPTGHQPPVYLAEAHLGLIKLLLLDQKSDDWWWSILETPDDGQGEVDDAEASTALAMDNKIPVIKIDMEALLDYEEDSLITASWMQGLDDVRNHQTKQGSRIRDAVKDALAVVANKWVKMYLRAALKKWKRNSAGFTKRAVVWLVDRVKDARPDLWGRNVRKETVLAQKDKVVEESKQLMEKMDPNDSIVIDGLPDETELEEEDSDEEDDDSDEEDESPNLIDREQNSNGVQDESLLSVTTTIPPRPLPTLVDFLLPPSKPFVSPDIVNSFTWPHLAAASVCRIIHKYIRQRNITDDSLRDFRGLPPMTVAERKEREALVANRVLSECACGFNGSMPVQSAVDHLCRGGHYLHLSVVERLCILKVLIDAAYDSTRVHDVVDDNYKSRAGATKALEMEEKRAKKEAREEAAAAESAARARLADEKRSQFFEEKREEIRKLNQRSNEYTDEFIDSLTDEDILEFDDDVRAEYDALPTPQSFNKTEVSAAVKQIQEETAFDTHAVRVVTLDDLPEIDQKELEAMEKELASFNGVDLYSLRREATRKVERLRKEIAVIKEDAASLSHERGNAVEILKEAVEDGTIKSLRSALKVAKLAKLSGRDEDSGGVWALDLVRDATLELKAAESRKKVVDAQKELIAKRDKCFIRTEPIGRDRFRNSFWHFEHDSARGLWTEADFILKSHHGDKNEHDAGYVQLLTEPDEIGLGAEEKEGDLVAPELQEDEVTEFKLYSRKEYHRSGATGSLVRRQWGGHVTEKSLRRLVKSLDGRGLRELAVKRTVKEMLESSPKQNAADEDSKPSHDENDRTTQPNSETRSSGDEESFEAERDEVRGTQSPVVCHHTLEKVRSAIGQRIRTRDLVDATKDPPIAQYCNGVVTGWKMVTEEREESSDVVVDGEAEREIRTNTVVVPVWQIAMDIGDADQWLSGRKVIEGICRFAKWKSNDQDYFEHDAKIHSYRNSLGRHCGKAADAGVSATPSFLAKAMVRREQELYAVLKTIRYDNTWGGKNGARNAWVSSMKDFCFDFRTARNGLLTLEGAFFELTGGFPEDAVEPTKGPKEILDDPALRIDVELESIDKSTKTLWSSIESRNIFLYIVESCQTVGFLALCFDLLCRNCFTYVEANKPVSTRGRASASASSSANYAAPMRTTRRMNAWQQANQDDWY